MCEPLELLRCCGVAAATLCNDTSVPRVDDVPVDDVPQRVNVVRAPIVEA